MKSWKRLLFYITLNIFVSTCTTISVLFAWDQVMGPLPRDLLPKVAGLIALRATPTPAAQPAEEGTPKPQATPTEAYVVYQVKSGDTFESIAAAHGLSVDELVSVNGFSQTQTLGEGEVLRIPLNPKGSVAIDSVIGAGDLDSERVLLKHRGGGEISLVGWRLEDEKGNVFVFPSSPQLSLYPGGAVNIYTRSGVNTVVDLYWGLDQPMWASGVTVILRDAAGSVHTQYVIP